MSGFVSCQGFESGQLREVGAPEAGARLPPLVQLTEKADGRRRQELPKCRSLVGMTVSS